MEMFSIYKWGIRGIRYFDVFSVVFSLDPCCRVNMVTVEASVLYPFSPQHPLPPLNICTFYGFVFC